MNRLFLFTITILLLTVACKNNAKKNMMSEMNSCDSAVIMYYHTPGNPRFFNMVKLKDKKSLSVIAADANGKVIKSKDTCTSQGKIYFYGKGDAVYVTYFSRTDECRTFSFIKTGEKYFTRMNSEAKELLDTLQWLAKEPVVVSQ
ncbi:MAG: hypothetical protein JNK27_09455 [Chitinophagaceae bacterium]|nr:hypothetical protein [Chitinophagaceae bacterium]